MDTREIAAEYRLSHWAQIIRERRESGLSIKAYCELAGMCQNTYFYWQRKLREASCLEVQSIVQEKPVKNEQTLLSGDWIVYNPEKTESNNSAVLVEIGQCRITATKETDMALLDRVCRVLVSLC